MLSHNDLFADVEAGIDSSGSMPLWMFSEHSKTVLVDPQGERTWTVAMLKGAMGRYRGTEQGGRPPWWRPSLWSRTSL
ncbi:hypothetical protein ACIBEH_31760 [Nocardia salmonicida]|uniref:hypothetical protein n=1 Tax=Nocardia salmonicida TaxID=53431 RepID=UPI003799383C